MFHFFFSSFSHALCIPFRSTQTQYGSLSSVVNLLNWINNLNMSRLTLFFFVFSCSSPVGNTFFILSFVACFTIFFSYFHFHCSHNNKTNGPVFCVMLRAQRVRLLLTRSTMFSVLPFTSTSTIILHFLFISFLLYFFPFWISSVILRWQL